MVQYVYMGAKVNIAVNSEIVTNDEVLSLSNVIPELVTQAMNAGDVFLYVDTTNYSVGIDPIEIFIQVNVAKAEQPEELLELIAEKVQTWKADVGFKHPINLNVIPVVWHSKIAI